MRKRKASLPHYAMDFRSSGEMMRMQEGSGTPLKQATQTIPIVFAQVSDPVRGGFVPSIAHPGGNITGFALYEYEIVEKWLELLKQLAPMADRVCVLYDPTNPTNHGQLPEIESRAPAFAVRSSTCPVGDAREIEPAIGTFASEPNGRLIVLPNPVTEVHRELIAALAAKYRLPAVYPYRWQVTSGGLACCRFALWTHTHHH